MHIIHFASELAPIAKVGGLGDVVYGLSKELVRLGHTVEIILPKYDCIDYNLLKNIRICYRNLWSYDGAYQYNNTIWAAEVDGLSVLLIEPHHPNYLFSRGSIYNCEDDIDRFLYFSRTAMEFLFKSQRNLDVLHLHDWTVAIAPVLLQEMYLPLGMKQIPTVLTLHNVEHQGKCSPKNLSQIGLRGELYLQPSKLQDPKNPLLINLLKGGITYATALTTVSPAYEKEIQTPLGGHGLETLFYAHKEKITGILNGIDEDFWNPELDLYLTSRFNTYAPFSPLKLKEIEEKKADNKKELQKKLGLEESKDRPLIVCISRLVQQKSPLLIAHAFRHVLAKGGQCVILGSTDCEKTEKLFTDLSLEHSSTHQGAILLKYNEPLSHLIYAASDLFVVPSLFEPCGLTQMIALRYGSIPVVRKTGGLSDTIFDVDSDAHPKSQRNGFVFKNPTKKDLTEALDRAMTLYKTDKEKWTDLQKQGMQMDYSWKKAGQKYCTLYDTIL